MEQNKKGFFANLNNKKIFIISLILSVFAIILGLAFLPMSPYFLYGFLYGLVALWFSLLIINMISKRFNVAVASWLIFTIRISIFLVFFLFMILFINAPVHTGEDNYQFFSPINCFTFFVSYMIFSWSAFLLPLYEYLAIKLSKKG